jgi:hypothetical protein
MTKAINMATAIPSLAVVVVAPAMNVMVALLRMMAVVKAPAPSIKPGR